MIKNYKKNLRYKYKKNIRYEIKILKKNCIAILIILKFIINKYLYLVYKKFITFFLFYLFLLLLYKNNAIFFTKFKFFFLKKLFLDFFEILHVFIL